MVDPRKERIYIRLLELTAVVSEEWGEAVKDINNYLWKDFKAEDAEKAILELKQLQSPLIELQALLETELMKDKRDGVE